MVRIASLSFLAVLVGAAFADTNVEQQVLAETPVHTTQAGVGPIVTGAPSDAIEVKSLSVSPDPPQAGEDLTVTVSATAFKTIEDGATADVVVKLGLIKLLTKSFDVCEEAREGDYVVVQTVALPKEIPPAKFNVEVRGYHSG
ncbi:hypothetical protein BU15DRAFT_61182 [Melanogaster broomeanus]|nr:hypothetical protein BU15DRAFT_61182 [Melanogaster broomeanus]